MPTQDENRKRAAELEKQYGLPNGMLWKVSGIESSHRGDAVGPVVKNGTGEQAKGWFQFMPKTAEQYGVKDPTDFNQSAEGAAKFLSELIGKNGGSVDKALTYYNGGHRAVAALESGKPWRETKDYLAKYNGSNTGSMPPQVATPTITPNQTVSLDPSVAMDPIAPAVLGAVDTPAFMDAGITPDGSMVTTEPYEPAGNAAEEAFKKAQTKLDYDGFNNSFIGLGKGLSSGLEQTSWMGFLNNMKSDYEPTYGWSPTEVEQDEALKGLSPEEAGKVMRLSMSSQEMIGRAASIRDLKKKINEAGAYGTPALIGSIVGTSLDVDTAVSLLIPQLGLLTLTQKGSRLQTAIGSGLATGSVNFGFEATVNDIRTLGNKDDLTYAALIGFGAGMAITGVSKRAIPNMLDLKAPKPDGNKIDDAIDDIFRLREQQAGLKGLDENLNENGKALKEKFDSEVAEWSEKFGKTLDDDTPLFINTRFGDEPTTLGTKGEPPDLFPNKLDDLSDDTPLGAKPTVNNPEYKLGEENFELRGQVRGGVTYADPTNYVRGDERQLFLALTSELNSTVDDFLSGYSFKNDGSISGSQNNSTSRAGLESLGITTRSDLVKVYKESRNKSKTEVSDSIRYKDTVGTRSVLDDIIKNSGSENLSYLAAFLKKSMPEDVPFSWVPPASWKRMKEASGASGMYDPYSHRPMVPSNRKDDYGVMLHEILHSATYHKLDFGSRNPNTPIGKLVVELEDLNKLALKAWNRKHGRSKAKSNYYLSDVYEFTAGLFSGSSTTRTKAFLDHLKSIPVAGGNMFHKLVDIVRNLFGMGAKETNALLKAYGLLGDLLDTRLDVKFKREGGVKPVALSPVNEFVDPETVQVANKYNVGEVYGFGLGLEYKVGGKGVRQSVRNLAADLIGTTVGYKDHGVVGRNAADSLKQLTRTLAKRMYAGTEHSFNKFRESGNYKFHEEGKAFRDFQTQINNYILEFEGDYHPSVIRSGNQYRNVMGLVVDHINNPGLHAGEVRKGLTQREFIDTATGAVKMTDPLQKNARYLNRLPDTNKWDVISSKFGNNPIEQWVSGAFRKASGQTEERSDQFAQWYVKTAYEGRRNGANETLDSMLRGQDKEGLKTSLMSKLAVDSIQADEIIAGMFPAKANDSGALSSSLKHRNSLDEHHTLDIVDLNGNELTLGYNDLFDTNVFDNFNRYAQRMSGAIALANQLNIYKSTDIDTAIANATKVELGGVIVTEAAQEANIRDLRFIFDRLMGVPQEDITKLGASVEMWNTYNVSKLMGGAIFNQFVESSQIIGSLGARAAFNALPDFKNLQRDLVTGKAPTDMLEHLENFMGGAGSDFVERMNLRSEDTFARKFGDTKTHRVLDSIDTGLTKLASGVLEKTGMVGLMVQQKRGHATVLVNHFIDLAHGKTTKTYLSKDRLAMLGLGDDEFASIKAGLVKYSKDADGKFAKTKSTDWDKWQQEDPKSHASFLLAIARESSRVVQENDLAAMLPVMGTVLGRTAFQFMNFSMQAWNKSLMFGINHADMATFSTIMYGGLLGSLAYMGRSQLSTIGMSEDDRKKFMLERMSLGQIVANGFGRTAQASLLPQIYDTTIGTLTGVQVFNGFKTTSDTSTFISAPTFQAFNSVLSMGKLFRNSIDGEVQTTSNDVRSWARATVPLGNVPPISTLINAVSGSFPTSDKQVPD